VIKNNIKRAGIGIRKEVSKEGRKKEGRREEKKKERKKEKAPEVRMSQKANLNEKYHDYHYE
jgi:hypothetical protein